MQNYQQIAAVANQQKAMQMAQVNDLMNNTLSRCYAAYLLNSHSPKEAFELAQRATHHFGISIGIIKEQEDAGNDNNSPIIRG